MTASSAACTVLLMLLLATGSAKEAKTETASPETASTGGQCKSAATLAPTIAAAFPAQKKKRQILHFVRHAEGFHNLVSHKYPRHSEGYERTLADPSFFDARLSPLGLQQCEKLREQVAQSTLKYDLILVSPLARTLQTLSIAFPDPPSNVPIIAVDFIRERFGLRPCDSRSEVSVAQKEFPHVDFSLVPPGPDPHMCARGQTAECPPRETEESMDERARELVAFLETREEESILIVGHSAFFARVFEKHLGWDASEGPYRMANAALRSIEVVYK